MRQSFSLWTCLCIVALFCSVHLPILWSQSASDEKSIRAVVEGYLTAKDWKERLLFVESPSKQEAAMQAKYQGVEFRLQNPSVKRIEEVDKLLGNYLVKATFSEKPKGQTFSQYYVVRKCEDGFKIDWPASVGYNPVSLKSLLAKKPKDTPSLRLIATIDSKYLDDYAQASDTHYCFLLKEDNPLQTVYGYIPKTDPDGQRLYDQLKKRKEAGDRVIVEIRLVGPAGEEAKTSRTVAITKLVNLTWAAP
jgi:hypothetical protein